LSFSCEPGRAERIYADDTTVPVLTKGKTATGRSEEWTRRRLGGIFAPRRFGGCCAVEEEDANRLFVTV